MMKAFLLVFAGLLFFQFDADAIDSTDVEVFTEEERLQGFAQHKENLRKWDERRQASSDEVKKMRKEWERERETAIADYKAWKAKQEKALDETSPEYFADLERKKRFYRDLEKDRLEYVQERDEKRKKKQRRILLTEEREYGLDENPERVEFRKRALYFADRIKKSDQKFGGGASSGAGSGSMDFSAPPPDFNPPMSQPPAPEFFEPEIPPPPPPPEFDDAIPPPIFEDSPDF